MVVSRRERWANDGKGKTVATASSAALTKRLSTPMRRLGTQMRAKAKHLGVPFTPGARMRQGYKRKSPWLDCAARVARTVKLGKKLGRHIFHTGLCLAVLYGSPVALPKITTSVAMRRAAARTMRSTKSRAIR